MNTLKNYVLKSILLIDDDEPTIFLHNLAIKKSNITADITVATNGQEALDFLSCNAKYSSNPFFPKPDIIFLDLKMPGVNGWDFLEQYALLPKEQKGNLLVVMLSTSLSSSDQEKISNIEEIGHFEEKPLTSDKILKILEKYF